MVWSAPGVRAMALSQSAPTPKTQELFLVVTTEPVGAPDAELNVPLAPMAADPLLPLVSAPLNATTVIEAAAAWDRLAATATFVKTPGANARQISASPGTLLARATNCHVSPAPLIDLTEFPAVEPESADTNA